jgi:predicted transcriptional regulator
MSVSTQVSVRLNTELRTAVERAAEEERRTVSNLVRNVLADWAKGRETQADRKEMA